MSKAPLAVLLCNLGTPTAPTPAAVRKFLKPFLSDPRVVEVPKPIWWLILNCFILPFRPKPVAEGYQALWQEFGDSPLRLYSESLVKQLNDYYAQSILVDYVFTYSDPLLDSQLDYYQQKAERILLIPMYPQYSCSTTAALYDQLGRYQAKRRNCIDAYIIKDYYQHMTFRQALANSIQDYWQENGRSEHLLISYHGVPKAYYQKGDPYYEQCIETSQQLADDLSLKPGSYTTSFQSRLGKAEWLKPYTDKTVEALAEKGFKTIDVVCPSFSVDCLETIEEIAEENKGYFLAKGGEKLSLIPCLNDSAGQIELLKKLITPFFNDEKK